MSAGLQPRTTTRERAASSKPLQRGNAAPLPSALMLPAVSIVIPTLNEAQNIGALLRRLHEVMRQHGILYEALIVDDHSSDATVAEAERTLAALRAPGRVLLKQGKPGKTYSLMQGLDEARYEALATLDGDLQYPPEALPALLAQLRRADVVVGDRRASYETADVRRGRSSQLFNAVIGRGLLSLDTDLQSGMKVFRREVYESALLRPGPWSFDLELLATAQENGYRIASAPIEMQPRLGGQSKVRMLRVASELGLRALAVRLRLATHTAEEDATELARLAARKGRPQRPTSDGGQRDQADQIRRYERWLMQDAQETAQAHTRAEVEQYVTEASRVVTRRRGGKQREFRPFAPHQPQFSALTTFTRGQVAVVGALALLWIASLVIFGLAALSVTLGVVTALYLFDLAVTMVISLRTFQRRPVTPISDQVVRGIRHEYWPSYTILCPLYHEAEVAAQFVNAMRLLDYPTDRLQVLFLTEEDDGATREALLGMGLPRHFQVVTVPDGAPRTKPRACNYGLLQASGDFVVIYDAEDIPDPLQLKKAVLTFAHHDADLACVQASLNFYNPSQNLLTRWFTSEYSLWFDLTLPALQRMRSFLPLGGTSNHFRTRILREVGGWDPFNVTEDCDLGVRLAQYHYRTAMVDSTTYEEANPQLGNWLRQRSRWVKGYMQTYLVYMRDPLRYVREGRLGELFWLQVIVGGKPLAQLLNPLLWLLLAGYIVFRHWVTPVYHILYPAPVFYASAFCLVFGNFFYVYSYLIGCLNRRQYLLTLWSLLIPFYWALMSVASYIALYQLLTRPHYWEKTKHGLHLLPRGRIVRLLSATGRGARGALGYGVSLAAMRLRQVSDARWAAACARGAQRLAAWLMQPVAVSSLTHGAFEYVSHELAMIRREVNRSGQQQAQLAPTISLPVAPVVDMLSTTLMPSLRVKPAEVADGGSKLSRETRYLVALSPLAKSTRTFEQPRKAPFRWLRDRWLVATLVTAITSSVSAFLYYYSRGDTVLYGDADSHMRLARMTFDAVTPGLAQLGDVWLPLPHMLMWPFIWSNYLWSTGMAGSFAGMICYVVTGLFVFKTARLLSGNDVAAYIGSLAYLLNPNILYLQSTPLSELALLATMAVTCYAFLVWTRTGEVWHLLVTAFCTLLATVTRYEGWSLFFALIVLIVLVEAFRRRSAQRILGEVLLFATPGAFGIGLWLLWCYILSGNPLFFQNGPYSAANQQQAFIARGQLPTFHNLPMDVLTYGADVLAFAGPLLALLAVIGLVVYLVGAWKRPEGMAALALVAPVALYIVSLYSGQIVLYVPGITTHVGLKDLFNVRYGASSVVPVAIFIGTLIRRRRSLQLIAIALILAQTTLTTVGGIVTLQDGQYGLSCRPFTTNDLFLAEHYNGGRILVDMYANAQAASTFQMLDIPLANAVNVASYKVWQSALADPAAYVDWVVISPNDAVSQAIDVNSAEFQASFILLQRDQSGNEIFYKRGLPTLPNRPAPVQLMQRYAQCNPHFTIEPIQAPTSAPQQTAAPVTAPITTPVAPTKSPRVSPAMVIKRRERMSQWAR